MTIKATYYIVHFTKVDRFVGIAHSYNDAVLISTKSHERYTEARAELQSSADEQEVELKWFDGEYECSGNGSQMVRAPNFS